MGLVWCPDLPGEKASFYLSAQRFPSQGHLKVQDGYWSAGCYSSVPSPTRTEDGRKDKRVHLLSQLLLLNPAGRPHISADCLGPQLVSWPHRAENEVRKFRIVAGYVSAPKKIGTLF